MKKYLHKFQAWRGLRTARQSPQGNKTGVHIVQGSRNGFGEYVKQGPALVVTVDQNVGLEVMNAYPHTTAVFRTVKPYLDAPNGIDQWTEGEARQQAHNYFPKFLNEWRQNPAHYYIVLNEVAGQNTQVMPAYVAYEDEMMTLAEQHGYKLCILNLAGGTPESFDDWIQYYVPHIQRAFAGGHIYGRHAYGGDLVPVGQGNNADRPLQEARYLYENGIIGQIAITELGLDGGYGYAGRDRIMAQLSQYDALMKEEPLIMGSAWWTLGDWRGANCQDALPAMGQYATANPAQKWQPPTPPPVDTEVLAVDVSRWQVDVDYQALAQQGVKAVYIKVGQGDWYDPQLKTHKADAKAAGLYVGGYWFLDNRYNIGQQAQMMLAQYHDFDLPPAVDIEENQYTPLPTLDQCRQFVDAIRPTFGRMVTYSSKYYYDRVSTSDNLGCELWVANYTTAEQPLLPTAWQDWQWWQFTSKGEFDGYDGPLDTNRFNGSLSELDEYVNQQPPEPPPGGDAIDLVDYFVAPESVSFEVKHIATGSQERFQVQHGEGGEFCFVKNALWEKWRFDNEFMYLIMDTSPSNDPGTGQPRYYVVSKGDNDAPWIRRHIATGESFDDGGHVVQFYDKANCNPLAANSGQSRNRSQLLAHHPSYTFKTGITLHDVIVVECNGEVHYFARGMGRVGWHSEWGESYISEIHEPGTREPYERESINCLNE